MYISEEGEERQGKGWIERQGNGGKKREKGKNEERGEKEDVRKVKGKGKEEKRPGG